MKGNLLVTAENDVSELLWPFVDFVPLKALRSRPRRALYHNGASDPKTRIPGESS